LEGRCNILCKKICKLKTGTKRKPFQLQVRSHSQSCGRKEWIQGFVLQLHGLQNALLRVSDLKVDVGKALYNVVDFHVQTLDSTLGALSQKLQQFGKMSDS
jgi:hypothetical protein